MLFVKEYIGVLDLIYWGFKFDISKLTTHILGF